MCDLTFEKISRVFFVMDSTLSPKSSKSPKSPVLSLGQRYGWVLGDPISVLPPKKRPTERDVLRHWMSISDSKFDKSRALSPKQKNQVVIDLVKSVSTHWMVQGFGVAIKSKDTIRSMIQRLIKNRVVNKYEQPEHLNRQFDFDWISDEQQKFEKVFDINKSSTPNKSVKRNLIVSIIRCSAVAVGKNLVLTKILSCT